MIDYAEDPPLFSARVLYLLGEAAVTLGLMLLLFAGYEFYGKAWETSRAQSGLDHDLDRLWADGLAPVPGQPASKLYIPRLHRHWVVVEGVTLADLAKGPGHYIGTDAPGETGNLAIAGHRLPRLFWDLDRLRPSDPIGVETRTGWFVYRVITLRTVKPNQISVIAHNPWNPGQPATRRLLTLTTCTPKFDNHQRLVVVAELSSAQGKRWGRPAALNG